MSTTNGSDPLDRLRAADPLCATDVTSASVARVEARVQEHIMNDIQHDPAARTSRRSLAGLGGLVLAGALVLAIAVGSGFGAQAPGPIGAGPSPSQDPVGGGLASCIVYDPATLPTFDVVFDGTITAIDGHQITFDVNDGWKGVDGSVTLTAPDTDISLLGPMPAFEVGGRYLVTAAGSNINACGYTLAYDAATAAAWAAAFGS